MKPIYATLVLAFISVLLLAATFLAHIFLPLSQTPEVVEIRVEQGEPFASVVRKLREQKIISNERMFWLWARLSGSEKKIQRGLYRFELPLPPQEVLNRLISGKGVFYRVTIPEGLTVKEVGELLAKMAGVDKERFLAEAENPQLLSSLGLDEKGLEGYLFPNTYQFIPETPEREVIRTMIEQFRRVFEPLILSHGSDEFLSPHDIVILASMIEKETAIEAERPLVSAVFHNRLRLNMPLQSDPTVIYGLKEFNGNLTRKDLQAVTPYNTYRIPSLPRGPICNPGLSSLKAALEPAAVPYLYFVSRNDGTHVFSDNLEAHSRAVKTYQIRQEPASRKAAARSR